MSTTLPSSGWPGVRVLNPTSDAPTLVFASLEVALAACHLRGLMWHAFHGGGDRAVALDVVRQAPGLAVGSWREWAALKVACENRAMGASQPTLPVVLDAGLMASVNDAAHLGPRVSDEFDDQLPTPAPPLVHLDPHWCWTPEGHWLLDALVFGDVQELQGLLDAGIDPNVRRDHRSSHHLMDHETTVPLDAWSYCFSLVLMREDEKDEAGLTGSIQTIRDAAGEVLERCLLHGLNPGTKVLPHDPQSPTRMDQLLSWTQNGATAPYGWGRRWLKAIEDHQLRRAMGAEHAPSSPAVRPRL